MQFMSFIKSVKKQMGSRGLAKVPVQINLPFTISRKKRQTWRTCWADSFSNKDNVLPHVTGTCRARWGPGRLNKLGTGRGEEKSIYWFITWSSSKPEIIQWLPSVNLQWSASQFGAVMNTLEQLAVVCTAACICLILSQLSEEALLDISQQIRENISLTSVFLRKVSELSDFSCHWQILVSLHGWCWSLLQGIKW